MAVCVLGFGLLCLGLVGRGRGVNMCLGGVMDIKPDSTGNGALAERAKVCTNVKCPFSCSWGRDRRPQTGRRVSVSEAETQRSRNKSIQPPP